MKPFNTLFYFLIGCTLFFCACNSVSNYNELKGTDSLVTLPFFNQPDWTPEWIKETDTGYNHIHTIPSFSFLDQNGMVVDEHLVNGKIYIANFFFTKCRNICPKMTNNLYLLQEEFKNDTSILLLSHSVTPETDDVNVLNKYALDNKVDAKKWHLLTGNKKEIYGLAKQQYFAGDTVGFYQSGNEFLHTENFILIDQHRRIRGVYNGTLLVEINRIKEDILILKSESSLDVK
jgi:protein SCO1/2